jgi:hypothetical protein
MAKFHAFVTFFNHTFIHVTVQQFLGNVEGCSFLRDFEINRHIKRYVKCPVSGYLSPQGPHWGTWRGFTGQDFQREKDTISGFLSWTQRTLRF